MKLKRFLSTYVQPAGLHQLTALVLVLITVCVTFHIAFRFRAPSVLTEKIVCTKEFH